MSTTPGTTPPRRGRLSLPGPLGVLRLPLAVVAAVLAVAVAGLPVFVHPQIDPLRPADAIVVLGGTPYERFDIGVDLARAGLAPELLIAASTGLDDPLMDRYCRGGYPFRVQCFEPRPWTTQGEAQEIRRRAESGGWRHIIVVTFTPHVSRARYIIGKCFDGELTMVASPAPTGLAYQAWMYLRQSAGYLRAFTETGC
ncbi:YdcF family protein [Nocardia higoensis]|uniref:YdcF family protein n=1 Tax=Nocardia higoensis TaxID=228599 RepID=A0ABS0D4T3_9NOCA|nr:YdcF family protein [Nocardia higoensis]MBF6353498.1 YdcF family protein [Nocardia higoensis]